MWRLLSFLRKPVILLVPVFLASSWFFAWRLREPNSWTKYEFSTGVIFEDRGRWGSVSSQIMGLADDGKYVITWEDDQSDWDAPKEEIQKWDSRTGRKTIKIPVDACRRAIEPAEGHLCFDDEAAWNAFQNRFADQRSQALADVCKKQGPSAVEEAGWFKVGGFSRDGRFVYYGTHDGMPVFNFYPLPEDEALSINGIAVDEVATGRRVAFLPGVARDDNGLNPWLTISPDGKTAVSHGYYWRKGEDEPACLILWDLESSRERAKVMIGENLDWENDRLDIHYSADSRLVIVCVRGGATSWWNTANGERHGQDAKGAHMTLLDGGKVLVTLADYYHEVDELRPNEFFFWDSTSAQLLGRIYLGNRGPKAPYSRRLTSSEQGRYFALEFDYDVPNPNAVPPAPKRNWFMRFLFPNEPPKDHSQILLFDGFERREVAALPGRQACFSPNGRWLATIDADGVVRVWELPLRKPWARILGFAAIATLVCALAYLLIRWPFRRPRSTH
jgi:hypothetical protein